MNDKYLIYEQIDRYIHEEMDPQELQLFNERLKNNPELQSLLEAQIAANAALVDFEFIELKDQIRADLETVDLSPKKGPSSGGLWLLLSTVVIISFIFIYKQSDGEKEVTINKPLAVKEQGKKKTSKNTNQALPQPDKKITVSNKEQQESPVAKNSKVVKIINEELSDSTTNKQALVEPVKSDNTELTVINKNPIQKNTDTVEVKKIHSDPCSGYKIKTEITTPAPCIGEGKGKLIIAASGGVEPYTYSLDKHSFQESSVFQNMHSGNYTLTIVDKNGCISEETIKISGLTCDPEYKSSFIPGIGEIWNIPVEEDESAIFSVINKNGQVVYKTNIVYGTPSTWDGKSNSGNVTDSGYYIFLIEYSSGRTFTGSITIAH